MNLWKKKKKLWTKKKRTWNFEKKKSLDPTGAAADAGATAETGEPKEATCNGLRTVYSEVERLDDSWSNKKQKVVILQRDLHLNVEPESHREVNFHHQKETFLTLYWCQGDRTRANWVTRGNDNHSPNGGIVYILKEICLLWRQELRDYQKRFKGMV